MNLLKRATVFACLAAAFCLLPSRAFAQANPRIGTWTLDLAKSSFQQGEKPGTETRTYLLADDGAIQMTSDAVLPSGTKRPTAYRAKYDGKDYPYSGMVGDAIAIKGDGWTSDATIKMHTKVEQTVHSTLSKDGKTMTLVTKTASGQPVSTRVYVKK